MRFAKIDISGIDRVVLLKALWEQEQPALFFSLCPEAPIPKWDETKAKEAVTDYIDYFQGRAIKTDLSGDIAETYGYNHRRGPIFEEIVNKLKKD